MQATDSELYASMIAGLEDSGMTRTDIARATGLSRTTIWRGAVGMWREPDHHSVVVLDRVFQLAVSPQKQLSR